MKPPAAMIIPYHDILLVEDDPALRALFGQVLETAGYTVHMVPDGRAALDSLASQPARLIITDIFMPETDGFEMLTNLRSAHQPPQIIAMSGGSVGDIHSILRTAHLLGAAHTLAKPFPLHDLLATVQATIGQPG